MYEVGTTGQEDYASGARLLLGEILGDELFLFDATSYDDPSAVVDTSFADPLSRPFVYTLAFPDFSGDDSTAYEGIDFGDAVTGVDISDSIAFEGDVRGMQLSRAQQLGDFDGDGFADTLISGPEYAFFLNGPFDIDGGLLQAAISADYQFDLTSLGRPSDTMGDLNGDGFTD